MNASQNADRLQRLMGYLKSDPDNPALLRECATLALNAGQPDETQKLLDHLDALGAYAASDDGLRALAAMHVQDFAAARVLFSSLQQANPESPALRYNLAWCAAMQKDFETALSLLDDNSTERLPQAAALKIELIHQLGRHEEAGAMSHHLVGRYPTHPSVLAAASVVAIDNEEFEAAADYAARAGDHPDAQITLGVLALSDDRTTDAEAFFARAISARPEAPRALIGSGLIRMLRGDHACAASQLTKGAEIFGGHIGSWIGAGWAQLLANDLLQARVLFERARAIDDTFAETHGSLSVIDVLEANPAAARKHALIAKRLDANCFSANLTFALLASAEGKPDVARAIIDRALNIPLDINGRTIAQSLTRLSLTT